MSFIWSLLVLTLAVMWHCDSMVMGDIILCIAVLVNNFLQLMTVCNTMHVLSRSFVNCVRQVTKTAFSI